MEKDSPSKPSVAELAGRFRGHILPMPTSNDEFRRRPPCSLKLQNQKDDNEESDKTTVSAKPFKVKVKSSPIIEKLQANLALSPTALLPSPKSPEAKIPSAPLSPTTPCSPTSPNLRPSHLSSEDEDPVSFSDPPEGTTLPSINKTRARLSFKRRPPTRQHRRSAGEESGAFGSAMSPCELYSPNENGDKDQAFNSPAEEAGNGLPASLKEAEEKDKDCEKTEDEVAADDKRRDPEEDQEAETLEEKPSEPSPAKPIEGDITAGEGQAEAAMEEGENDRV
ncbi:capZ-interacting protein isoform X1 [Larimichthys crocea]|uniref:capZ-interacting protein isoform X1 n=2 Tax=Larimichthys crocea TaxID=215358 RepID=UPI000F5F7D85|nr:capZ-interacting protein isoform X1 [Larimichthys crocea]